MIKALVLEPDPVFVLSIPNDGITIGMFVVQICFQHAEVILWFGLFRCTHKNTWGQ